MPIIKLKAVDLVIHTRRAKEPVRIVQLHPTRMTNGTVDNGQERTIHVENLHSIRIRHNEVAICVRNQRSGPCEGAFQGVDILKLKYLQNKEQLLGTIWTSSNGQFFNIIFK